VSAGGPGAEYDKLCVPVGTAIGSKICVAGSPADWYNCDENNIGNIKDIDGDEYICSITDGDYVWLSQMEKSVEPTFIDLIIQFFQKNTVLSLIPIKIIFTFFS